MMGICEAVRKTERFEGLGPFLCLLHGCQNCPLSAAVNIEALALEDLTCFQLSGIDSSTFIQYHGCSAPLLPRPAFPAPLPSPESPRLSGSLLRKPIPRQSLKTRLCSELWSAHGELCAA